MPSRVSKVVALLFGLSLAIFWLIAASSSRVPLVISVPRHSVVKTFARRCRADEVASNVKRDWSPSNCPDQGRWFPAHVKQFQGKRATIVSIGCNKGSIYCGPVHSLKKESAFQGWILWSSFESSLATQASVSRGYEPRILQMDCPPRIWVHVEQQQSATAPSRKEPPLPLYEAIA